MTKKCFLPIGNPYYENVPDYMTEVYDWAYVNPRNAGWLDNDWVVRILLFFNDQRLMRAYLNEVSAGMRVWQVAHVYGDLVRRVAKKVGPKGAFLVTDVTPVQVEHARAKLAGMDWARVVRADAGDHSPEGESFDVICSFFLLHEVPEEKKAAVVDNMLRHLVPGKKLVFVDYSNPKPWQPIRYILKFVNHFLEPFAEALWKKEIRDYARDPERFVWRRETFFAGVYQCVVVEHANADDPEVSSLLRV
jgi:ubiquinone/menaquinone biosynthesis C-methylase UbiE